MTTYIANREILQEVLTAIDRAEKYLKIGNFLFQYTEVVKHLKSAAERGVAIFILTNTSQKKLDRKRIAADSQEECDTSVLDTHLSNIAELFDYGVHVRGLDCLHAKFLIVDGKVALLTSCNFSSSSMDRNIENGILLSDKELKDLERMFCLLYERADINAYSKSFGQTVEHRHTPKPLKWEPSDRTQSRMRYTVCGQKGALEKCNETGLYKEIVNQIKEAKKFCYIVCWRFNALDNLMELTDAVKDAASRGVEVTVYCNLRAQKKLKKDNSIKVLKAMGCKVLGNDVNHSKCVLTERGGIIFTANIDGEAGMKKGFEVGCLLNDEQYTAALAMVNGMKSEHF